MIQKISELIDRCRVFLITTHERPDGDAIGSSLALHHMLRGMGKESVVYCQDEIPENYRFLPASDRIVGELPPPESFDAAFILDCGEIDRVGREAKRVAAVSLLVNIDHHVSNGGFCDTTLIDTEASSTGELIFRLASHMGHAISEEMASCIYTAILTDTGGFRYGNAGRGAHLAAAELVSRGANPQWISENVYETNPPAKIRLLAAVLPTLSLDEDGSVGSLVVMRQALAEAGAMPEHTEGFVDLPRTIRGVQISILYSEMPDGRFKLSMRSKGKVNVERVARTFGGGGHLNAAACMVAGELPDIRRRVLEVIRSFPSP
jgi:phosphoesterase RecJ-like protein